VDIKYYLFRSLRNRIINEVTHRRYKVCDIESEYSNYLKVLSFEDEVIENQKQIETKKRLQKSYQVLSKRQREVLDQLLKKNSLMKR